MINTNTNFPPVIFSCEYFIQLRSSPCKPLHPPHGTVLKGPSPRKVSDLSAPENAPLIAAPAKDCLAVISGTQRAVPGGRLQPSNQDGRQTGERHADLQQTACDPEGSTPGTLRTSARSKRVIGRTAPSWQRVRLATALELLTINQ